MLNSFESTYSTEKLGKEFETSLSNILIFSIFWGFGSVIEENHRHEYNAFFLKLIYFENVVLTFGLVMENDKWQPKSLNLTLKQPVDIFMFYFDIQLLQWIEWTKVSCGESPNEHHLEYHQIIIPTLDTIKNATFMNLMIKNKQHFFMVGSTGTSKTVGIVRELDQNYYNQHYSNIKTSFSGQTKAN